MEYKVCNIAGFEGLYHIYENGDIYSVRKQRLIKHQLSGIGYVYSKAYLTGHTSSKWFGVHQLVAHHFICPKPSLKHEVNHIDMDKQNNHYTNLEWITHQQNMKKARELNNWNSGRESGFAHSDETKAKMAIKKHKKVLLFNDNQKVVKESVQDVLLFLNIPRRTFNRYVGSNKTIKGFKMKLL